ncbi:MAG: transposase [Wenzhouxiangella sp.]
MASIPQTELFCWRDVDELGDLERLKLVLNHLPDEQLMQQLERRRGNGRDDYPIRAVWNSIIAAIVFQHPSVESLRRELLRNAQLRELCGFSPLGGTRAVPPAWAYTRFLASVRHRSIRFALVRVFQNLVQQCFEHLPGFGESLAGDGKALASAATRRGGYPGDHRGEHDADWGRHEHRSERKDGTIGIAVKKWFGFTAHTIVESRYELPIAFCLTRASRNEKPIMRKLLQSLARRNPEILERAKVFTGDRGFDETKLLSMLWDKWRIRPVIDICNHWKDGERTKVVPGTENILYDYRGRISCSCPKTGMERPMAYGGFEADRNTLKYRCPARHYGMTCDGIDTCPIRHAVRIPLSVDRRVFTPVARSSYKWQTLYNARSAVERVHSRLDVSFGFEQHTIRGHDKMAIRLTIVYAVMLALAIGRVKTQQGEHIRSLVRLVS